MEYIKRSIHKNIKITEGFWKEQIDKISTITARDILNKFSNDHEEGLMSNYEYVINGETGKHVGPPWYDGLINEVIRGLSDLISINYDEYIDNKIEEYVNKIKDAQNISADGYVNTYTTLMCPDQKWGKNGGSLLWQHELYNIGCLVEGGVHYFLATGKITLLVCGIKAVNCLCNNIGEEPRYNIVPAHSLPEEAILKLYRLLTDEVKLKDNIAEKYNVTIEPKDYLELVKFWYDHRGVHHNRVSYPPYMGEYAQDHCTIDHQHEAVGHAVRAALMYTGLVTLGIELEDNKYIEISKRIWENVEKTKLHVSGGIGAIHNEERFGYQYDLPNNAYLETCAGVAMIFWASELFRAEQKSNYIDVLERALYNNVLPGLSISGTKYFYENPLRSDGSVERWEWHGCPCCPPMFIKVMGSLQDYIYGVKSNNIFVNLFIGSSMSFFIDEENITIEQKGTFPLKGDGKIILHLNNRKKFTVSIRKPKWAVDMVINCSGEKYLHSTENGYIEITREWQDRDEIDIEVLMPPTKIEAHPFVKENRGKVALFKGPLLYCFEEIDNDVDVHNIILCNDALKEEGVEVCGVKTIAITGKTKTGYPFKAIPYYLWNNRSKGKMEVWVKQIKDGENLDELLNAPNTPFAAHRSTPLTISNKLDGWDGLLYRKFS
ncbi:MAG: glycoside hydrolase family 127 protein [Lachnospirales bacterium]